MIKLVETIVESRSARLLECWFQRRGGFDLPFWACAVSLMCVAGAFRFYRLDNQLWLDEIAALSNYRKPFLEILTKFPGFFPNPLYELLAHASLILFGDTPFAIRLPAALFGMAGVFVFYRLAHRLSGRGESFLAGALLAVSYHHIFFSQNARGYTAFLFFALWSTDLLVTLLKDMRWRTGLAYAGVTALTVYAHPFGLFVPAGQMLMAFPVVWFHKKTRVRNTPTPTQLLGVAGLINVIILVLYAPIIRDSINFALTTARVPGHGFGVFGLVPELLEGLRAALFGWSGVVLAGAVGAIGTLDLLRKQPLPMAALLLPLLLSAVVVSMLGVGVHPRYFLLALPIGYLAATRGIVLVAAILERFLRFPPERNFVIRLGFGTLLVVVAVFPLFRYYAYPKQDYLGALEKVRALAGQQDRIVAADLAAHAIQTYYEPEFRGVENLADLLREEAMDHPVWVLTTLEQIMAVRKPELMAHLRQHYRLVQVLPGSLGDGAMRIYVRDARFNKIRHIRPL